MVFVDSLEGFATFLRHKLCTAQLSSAGVQDVQSTQDLVVFLVNAEGPAPSEATKSGNCPLVFMNPDQLRGWMMNNRRGWI
jgi:hypothetical protein